MLCIYRYNIAINKADWNISLNGSNSSLWFMKKHFVFAIVTYGEIVTTYT